MDPAHDEPVDEHERLEDGLRAHHVENGPNARALVLERTCVEEEARASFRARDVGEDDAHWGFCFLVSMFFWGSGARSQKKWLPLFCTKSASTNPTALLDALNRDPNRHDGQNNQPLERSRRTQRSDIVTQRDIRA